MKKLNNGEKKHDFMAMELLCPNADKTDSNRLYMFGSSHIAQAANLKYPEKALVFTNFENEVGNYSDLGFNETEEPIEILGKVTKNKNVYYLVIHKLESDTYDILERREEFWLTEKYGFTINNEYMDTLVEGNKVDKGIKINKCHNYDEEDNFMYGVNLRTIYYTEKCKTLEDPIVISKSAADKMLSHSVEQVTVVLNNNDLMLNLSDNPDDYVTFPDLDKINNILCVRRRIDHSKIYTFDDLSLNTLRPDDEKFYVEGTVVDIDIYNNMEEKDLGGNYNKQVRHELKKRTKYNNDFLKATEAIIESSYAKCSSQFIQMYNRVLMEKENIPFSYENSVFSGIVLKFTVLKENKLVKGSKISGRFGRRIIIL